MDAVWRYGIQPPPRMWEMAMDARKKLQRELERRGNPSWVMRGAWDIMDSIAAPFEDVGLEPRWDLLEDWIMEVVTMTHRAGYTAEETRDVFRSAYVKGQFGIPVAELEQLAREPIGELEDVRTIEELSG